MGEVWTAVVGVVLMLWFVLGLLRYVPALRRGIERYDGLALLPTWFMFANPRVVDYAVLRRDVLDDGTLTRWHELPIALPSTPLAFVWNPRLLQTRALLQICDALRAAGRRWGTPGRVPLGQGSAGASRTMTRMHYLVLLAYVSARSHPAVLATQFMVVSLPTHDGRGDGDVATGGRPVFVSELHLVGRPPVPLQDRDVPEPLLAD
jgi:hypothetical protein